MKPHPSDEARVAVESADRDHDCDLILIAKPDAIQPTGAVLVLDPKSGLISHCSSNITDFFPDAVPEQLIGRALFELSESLQVTLKTLERDGESGTMFATPHGNIRLSLHRHLAGHVVDLERAILPNVQSQQILADIIHELVELKSSSAVLEASVEHISRLLPHAHVMVYEFDGCWRGAVTHEWIKPGQDSYFQRYLGLHFPASDIPSPARALYRKYFVRSVFDTEAKAVALLGASGVADLSASAHRAMAPTHLQYLRNMGVRSTISMSIIVDGDLWGLLAAHHHEPVHVDAHARQICQLYAQVLSSTLALRLQAEDQAWLQARQHLYSWPLQIAKSGQELFSALADHLPAMLDGFAACGVVIWGNGVIAESGMSPSSSQLLRITRFLATRPFQFGFWYADDFAIQLNAYSGTLVSEEPLPAQFSGLLAIGLPERNQRYLLIFRQEEARTIRWGGDPRPEAMTEVDGVLHPRRSFAVWCEEVKGRSKVWSTQDCRLAEKLAEQLLQALGTMTSLAEAKLIGRQETTNMVLHDLGNAVSGLLCEANKLADATDQNKTIVLLERLVMVLRQNCEQMAQVFGEQKAEALQSMLSTMVATMREANIEQQHSTDGLLGMLKHVNDLLDLQRVYAQSSRPLRREFHIEEVVEDALVILGHKIKERGLVAKDYQSALPAICADRSKILQIIVNLVKNAYEAWDARSGVKNSLMIRVAASSTSAGGMRLTITDNGVGFEPSLGPALLMSGVSNKNRGSGLGLKNCARLALACGATINLESVGPNCGATATLLLPKEICHVE